MLDGGGHLSERIGWDIDRIWMYDGDGKLDFEVFVKRAADLDVEEEADSKETAGLD